MDIFQALYSLISFLISIIESVFNAAASLISELPAVLNFLTQLPLYVPSFCVAFLLAGVFGTVILIILARRS